MKVLLVATVQSHICQFHRPLVELLHENGYQVHVAARNNLEEKNGLKLDFVEKVYDIPFSRSPKSLDNVKAFKQLKQVINSEKYEVIHCNTPMGGIVTRFAAIRARKKGTKVFYTAHGFHFYKGAPIMNWLIYYPIEKVFAHLCDKLITINGEDYRIASRKMKTCVCKISGVGVDENRFYEVDTEKRNQIRQKLDIPIDKKLILCVGELLNNKNQQMIIRSMQEIIQENSNILLYIAGNGPLKFRLESLIKELSLEGHVKLLGYVTNIDEYQKACDLAVSCSVREGLGLNVIEAMLSGKPSVVTENRGHRELVENQKNGFLVPINDVSCMSRCIMKLFSSDELYREFAENSKKKASQYICMAVKEELKNIYEL